MNNASARLQEFLSEHPNTVVLTGAGISAQSGIPTYRDAAGVWQRSTPIRHQEFMAAEKTRRRYWLRSFKGWPAVSGAEPNAAHRAIASLEALGRFSLTVTQNVDRLHQKAGSHRVVDLHGRLDEVVCMSCGSLCSRESIQQRLQESHPTLDAMIGEVSGTLAPDGDADVEDSLAEHLKAPECLHCGGVLKPNVVFFGDSVPKPVVQQIYSAIEAADALVVAGSSLQVFSGFRFCRHAADHKKSIVSINPGKTRGDELMTLRLGVDAGDVLPDVARAFSA